MKIISSFFTLIVFGYVAGTISKSDLFFGVFIFLSGTFYFIWIFQKKLGRFQEKSNTSTLTVLFLSTLLGFNLGFFNFIDIEERYKYGLILIFFIVFSSLVILSWLLEQNKLNKSGKRSAKSN